jgi:tight adherence protein C
MSPLSDGMGLYSVVAAMILMASGAITVLWVEIEARRMTARVNQAVSIGDAERPAFAGIKGVLQRFGAWLQRYYRPENIEHMRGLVQASGFNPHRALPMLLAGKFLVSASVMSVAVAAAWMSGSVKGAVLIISFGGMAGVMGPEVILAFVRRRFVSDLRRGTPDALDLLVVCSEAGMALESALERVSQEMRMSNRAMASVLAGLLDDLRVLPDRREAFTNLGTRSGLDGLKRVGTMLSQSLQYGTPLSRALRAVAEELRRERMNRLEENAVKLPAKLIFPLILFIMPSLYIVLLGPSFMKLYDALHAISHSLH